jgi:hypothetical protein
LVLASLRGKAHRAKHAAAHVVVRTHHHQKPVRSALRARI